MHFKKSSVNVADRVASTVHLIFFLSETSLGFNRATHTETSAAFPPPPSNYGDSLAKPNTTVQNVWKGFDF